MEGHTGRRRSDSDLRRAKLRITDPYQQDDLVHTIPPGAGLVEILNVYYFARYPAEKAHCAKCGRCLHAKGMTARLSTGDIVMLGADCGREEFGESWEQAEKKYRDERSRQGLLFRLDVLVPLIPSALVALEKWRDACRPLVLLYGRFYNTHIDVFTKLRDTVRRGGNQLVAYELRRDYAAEAMAPSHSSDDVENDDDDYDKKKRREIWTSVPVPMGSFAGSDFFADIRPNDVIDEACAALREIAAVAGNTDSLRLSKMRAGARRLRKAVSALELIPPMHRAATALFAADNLALIAACATRDHNTSGRYAVRKSALVCVDSGKAIALPPDYPGLDESVLAMLRDPDGKEQAA